MKILAAQRLTATAVYSSLETHLMARATPITKVADSGIKEITRQMMLRDYRVNTVITRAFYTTTFTKEDKSGQFFTYQLVGWHGNGHYGSEKTILEFYDDQRSAKPVITIGAINEDSLTEASQIQLIKKIEDYIHKHC